MLFYNTLTRKKEEFKPISDVVGIYTCGPTVYAYAHIGNLRAMVFYDLVRRYLKFKGFKIKHVMNITDVDDKIIKKIRKEGKNLKEFTDFYTKSFFDDLEKLNIEKPDVIPKATEHIQDMVNIITKLKANGHTYEKSGSIYYKISSFGDYGKLALLKSQDLKKNASGRLDDEYEKDDARDFALWKAYGNDDGNVFWETSLGKGRPGWHIECSAMSSKYLGETFDIHLGGVDLIFPHHTNEIAQSEGASGKKFVNYWLHNEHLIVDGKKMSKSLGNFHTLRDLEKWDPRAIRYLFISAHYRTKLNFTEKALKGATETIDRLENFIDFIKSVKTTQTNPDVNKILEKTKAGFEKSMDDDLNMPEALAFIFNMMKDLNKTIADKGADQTNLKNIMNLLERFDSVLGLNLASVEAIWKPLDKASNEIKKLVKKRENLRKQKEWEKADEVRNEILKLGIIIEDTPKGIRWKKK